MLRLPRLLPLALLAIGCSGSIDADQGPSEPGAAPDGTPTRPTRPPGGDTSPPTAQPPLPAGAPGTRAARLCRGWS